MNKDPAVVAAKKAAMRLLARAQSYLGMRQRAYKVVFTHELGKEVLSDLTRFCRGNVSTFHPDPRVHAQLEGRREVLLRITQHLNLSFNDLWELYDGRELHND